MEAEERQIAPAGEICYVTDDATSHSPCCSNVIDRREGLFNDLLFLSHFDVYNCCKQTTSQHLNDLHSWRRNARRSRRAG